MTGHPSHPQQLANTLAEAEWNTSRYSGGSGGTCAEVALAKTSAGIRNSRDPGGPMVEFTPDEWVALYLGMRDGDPNVCPPAAWVRAFLERTTSQSASARKDRMLGMSGASVAECLPEESVESCHESHSFALPTGRTQPQE